MSKAEAKDTVEHKATPAPGRGRRILMPVLMILLGVLALAGGLVGSMGPKAAIALLTGGGGGAPAEQAHDAEMADSGHSSSGASDGHGAPAAGHGPAMTVSPFKEIIVNITATTASGRQTTRFLKLNVALVYDAAQAGAENVEGRKLFLRDSFQDYLRQLSERDLQGSYGLAMLKTELLRRARAISASDAPQDILISDLIVQ